MCTYFKGIYIRNPACTLYTCQHMRKLVFSFLENTETTILISRRKSYTSASAHVVYPGDEFSGFSSVLPKKWQYSTLDIPWACLLLFFLSLGSFPAIKSFPTDVIPQTHPIDTHTRHVSQYNVGVVSRRGYTYMQSRSRLSILRHVFRSRFPQANHDLVLSLETNGANYCKLSCHFDLWS